MKKAWFFSLFFAAAFALSAEELIIDMRYNVLRSEPSRDYLNWTSGNRRIQDSYDAVTGASAARSTREFDSVWYDTAASRRYTLPQGIRHLLLFPVASRRTTDDFHLTVQEEGQKLRIRFIVYGTVYQIQTDDNKKIDLRTGCFLAENITERYAPVSPLRARYVKPGGNANDINALDWDKINLVPDTAAPNASRKYTGLLTAGYSGGVLTIKGVLTVL
ncbi:MAG: hypothetical protein LBK66_05700 [Spirochaetaceae bacterium]|jgi:hypothetical protein|nr:hypothetical protein [Spirochaetaceae bacterium]